MVAVCLLSGDCPGVVPTCSRPYVPPSVCVSVRVRKLGLLRVRIRVRVKVRDTQRGGHVDKPPGDTQRQVSARDI